MVTKEEFFAHNQGKRFKEFLEEQRVDFDEIIDFFNQNKILKQMENAQRNHNLPALAGVIMDFEKLSSVNRFFGLKDKHRSKFFRRVIDALVFPARRSFPDLSETITST